MLADPRAASLVRNFALKWLNVDNLNAVQPDPLLFPSFNDQLRQDFGVEIESFVSSILLQDRNVNELLTANHTFLNERLARHYGITSVFGPQFRRVELQDPQRWGLLGKGAVLLRTSYGDRTSPVLARRMGAGQTHGDAADAAAARCRHRPVHAERRKTEDVARQDRTTSLEAELQSVPRCHRSDWAGVGELRRDRPMARHRCAGRGPDQRQYRSAQWPAVDGPAQLRQGLFKEPSDQFAQALTEKFMMYALGRELEYFDMPQVRAVVRRAAKDDYRLSAIVVRRRDKRCLPHAGKAALNMNCRLWV